ncbi:hypothetical protein DVH05_001637 [Phytophthora capsici]|nr:hypothetical protein DVH05_001637 [Phytophthora capsici]
MVTATPIASGIVIAHGGTMDTRTDKFDPIGITSDQSTLPTLTRVVGTTYGVQEKPSFNGRSPMLDKICSTLVIKTDAAHAMKISYTTRSLN